MSVEDDEMPESSRCAAVSGNTGGVTSVHVDVVTACWLMKPPLEHSCRNINQLQDAWFSDQLAVRQKVGLVDEPVTGVVSGQVIGAVWNRIAWHA